MRARRAVALLEVLAAMTILAIAVSSVHLLLGELGHLVADAAAREQRMRQATSLLTEASIVPTDSLVHVDRRRTIHGLEVRTQRVSTSEFSLSVRDATTGAVLLETTRLVEWTPRGANP